VVGECEEIDERELGIAYCGCVEVDGVVERD
jgi:hypothetical protein